MWRMKIDCNVSNLLGIIHHSHVHKTHTANLRWSFNILVIHFVAFTSLIKFCVNSRTYEYPPYGTSIKKTNLISSRVYRNSDNRTVLKIGVIALNICLDYKSADDLRRQSTFVETPPKDFCCYKYVESVVTVNKQDCL